MTNTSAEPTDAPASVLPSWKVRAGHRVLRTLGYPNFLRQLQWPAVRELLELTDGALVLDIGAGLLQYSTRLAREKRYRVVATDLGFLTEIVDLAARWHIETIRCDANKLPFQNRSVDRILLSSVVHMVPDPVALLRECRRVLKDNGLIVFSVPNNYRFLPIIIRSLRQSTLGRLLRIEDTESDFLARLNRAFGVRGPSGNYSLADLQTLVERVGLKIDSHVFSPRPCNSFIWELAVLFFSRFGGIAFYLVLMLYPAAWILEKLCRAGEGCEHVVQATIHDSVSIS